jgi:Zn-dependent M28 family amino/carboxypeptidase
VAILEVENSPGEEGDVARRVLDKKEVDDEKPIIPGAERQISLIQGKSQRMPWEGFPRLQVSRQMADQILGFVGQDIESLKDKIESTLKSHSMVLEGVSLTIDSKVETKLVSSKNVLGYLEGSDPELKDEVVVIGAHLDHEGMRGEYIFNGADDNGSGSVGVLEVAEAFVRNPEKPKRSVLFALWTGEEKGLLGSRYYVANPYFPLKKTVANINLDMISREFTERTLRMMARMVRLDVTDEIIDKIDLKKFAIGMLDTNSPENVKIIRESNQYVGASVYLHQSNGRMGGGGSDHNSFSWKHIPYVFFSAALTEDYHQPSDDVDKVSPDLMERLIRLTYLTACTLADK